MVHFCRFSIPRHKSPTNVIREKEIRQYPTPAEARRRQADTSSEYSRAWTRLFGLLAVFF